MTFLNKIAQDLIDKYGTDLHKVTVVFPNKRASLFMNRALAELCGKPLWSPKYTTISELFRSMSTWEIADRIKLVCELHKSYREVTGSPETLDQFYNWGEMMLSDFDDIDKHLGNAKHIFTLLGDTHEMDSVDYLTPEQIEELQRFFKNFSVEHNSILKQRFLDLWCKFYDIYSNYRQRLSNQGIAYEGMLYRDVIENKDNAANDSTTIGGHYIFVGFNLLTPVEQLIITRTNGKIYYDDDNSYPPKQVSILSAPTDDLQARYITQWLTPERIKAGRNTAIVLADESLLETVLHCLPNDITLNITTGYPLSQASITSLIRNVTLLLMHGNYTLHNINGILRHPLAKYISQKAMELHHTLNQDLIYYLTPEEISIDDNLRTLFTPLTNKNSTAELTERLIWLTKTVACAARSQEDALTDESIYRMFTLLNRLLSLILNEEIDIDYSLYFKLLQQIIQTTTIPFHGEPIEGIQVMGVLETRNLDFDHVLLLSCNEGKMPAKVNDSSFIPHSVREAYGLTTVENKVAIYKYYFDRLLQRSQDVSITYNKAVADGKTGEMSRFMLQLIADDSIPIKRYALEASLNSKSHACDDIIKTPEMIDRLRKKQFLSPSALGTYLRCPLHFYYSHVEGIRDDEVNDEEEMDNKAFGIIFHAAAEMIYQPYKGKVIPQSYINDLLKEKGHPTLRRIVEQAFREHLFNIKDDKRKTPKLGGLQVINYEMVITFLLNMLRYDSHLTRLEISDLEKKVVQSVDITINGAESSINIGGFIDRLDKVTDTDGIRRMRVIDYKTGRQSEKRLNIPSIADIFRRDKMTNHADYFLQALLYALILSKEGVTEPLSTGLLYVQHANNDDYTPLLNINNEPIYDAKDFLDEFQQGLTDLIQEILDVNKPFSPTADDTQCTNCPFYHYCH